MQQFQQISQANEAALAALNGTFDEYRASSEAQAAALEVSPALIISLILR